jgi:hypothetical protein
MHSRRPCISAQAASEAESGAGASAAHVVLDTAAASRSLYRGPRAAAPRRLSVLLGLRIEAGRIEARCYHLTDVGRKGLAVLPRYVLNREVEPPFLH